MGLLFWLVLLLAVLAFVQAVVLFPWLVRGRGGDEVLVSDVNLPEREVRVLVAPGPPLLLLKTPLDLPGADRSGRQDLDARLFPGGERHRYYVLFVLNPGEGEVVLDLAASPLLLEDARGRTHAPVDLRAAVRRRAGSLPDYLRLYLRMRVPGDGRARIGPGARRRILLAYPEDADPARLVRARTGEATLLPRTYAKDDLDGRLEMPGARLRAERP